MYLTVICWTNLLALHVHGFISEKVLRTQASQLESDVKRFYDTVTDIHYLESIYNINMDSASATFERVDLPAMLETVSSDISAILNGKIKALDRLVEKAEDLVINYTYVRDPEMYDYHNTKELGEEELTDEEERFGQNVQLNYSAVHIPVEIYEGEPDILNAVTWTQGLDETFKKNLLNDSSLLWQYFGSQTGVMRTYPASKWHVNEEGLPDLYDVRRRLWYSQGSSSAKDVLILIDKSGSVHGLTLELIKLSVKSILDTMGEDDFVNVYGFSTKFEKISCFETLVQANLRNKQVFFEALDYIKDENQSNYTLALTSAFEELHKFRNLTIRKSQGYGAACHEVIMILTDGATEYPEEVFKKYNENQKVRVFTYAVGPIQQPSAALKRMACDNKGFFTSIPAMGAIRGQVQAYQLYLGIPLGIKRIRHHQWCRDTDPRGLGMITTVTRPVYNTTSNGTNTTVVGVMGVDVSIDELTKDIPGRKLGPSGYVFALNSNGYLLFHPLLKAETSYLKNPSSIDFLEIEFSNKDKEKLRKQMIDGEGKSEAVELDTLVRSVDKYHLWSSRRMYAYAHLPNTSFSLGVVLPTHDQYYMTLSIDHNESSVFNDLLPVNTSQDLVLIPNWSKYCANLTTGLNVSERIQALYDIIKNNASSCDEHLMNDMLLDAKSTLTILKKWLSEESEDENVMSRYVLTRSGHTRVMPPSYPDHLLQDIDPYDSTLFPWALDNEDIYLFDADHLRRDLVANETSTIHIVKSALVHVKHQTAMDLNYTIAVIGVDVKSDYLCDQLTMMTFDGDEPADGSGGEEYDCGEESDLICYLLNDASNIIAVNRLDHRQYIGRFLADIDTVMMLDLINSSIYMQETQYDYQARCKKEEEEDDESSATSITINHWAHSIFSLINPLSSEWIIKQGSLFIYMAFIEMKHLIVEALSATCTEEGEAMMMMDNDYDDGDEGDDDDEIEDVYGAGYTCIKRFSQYTFGVDYDAIVRRTLTCTPLQDWYYIAKRLPHTNLVLVIATRRSGCDCAVKSYTGMDVPSHQSLTVEESIDLICKQQYNPRYRKRPPNCYDHDANETRHCAASTNHLPITLLLFPTLFSLLLMR